MTLNAEIVDTTWLWQSIDDAEQVARDVAASGLPTEYGEKLLIAA